jgi:hypothetical protein
MIELGGHHLGTGERADVEAALKVRLAPSWSGSADDRCRSRGRHEGRRLGLPSKTMPRARHHWRRDPGWPRHFGNWRHTDPRRRAPSQAIADVTHAALFPAAQLIALNQMTVVLGPTLSVVDLREIGPLAGVAVEDFLGDRAARSPKRRQFLLVALQLLFSREVLPGTAYGSLVRMPYVQVACRSALRDLPQLLHAG